VIKWVSESRCVLAVFTNQQCVSPASWGSQSTHQQRIYPLTWTPQHQASTMRPGSSRTWCALIWLSDTCLRRRGDESQVEDHIFAMIEDPCWKGHAISNHPWWGSHGNCKISWLLGLLMLMTSRQGRYACLESRPKQQVDVSKSWTQRSDTSTWFWFTLSILYRDTVSCL
jgi:hypothetical protein